MSLHQSVLLPETIDLLALKEDGVYVDLTLGRAGTSSAILKRIPRGHLYCFDLDYEAIEESKERLKVIGSNFDIIHANFACLVEELAKLGVTKVDGITADLGVSSPQFDEGKRGFSYKHDAPLDMRMDKDNPLSAKEIVNAYRYEDLARIFRLYGEDKDASKVANLIVKERAKKPIETTYELVDVIKRAKPMRSLNKKGHPAKQIFQALRIETNDELSNLETLLANFPVLLNNGGRIAIITFHSLEDRLVKQAFRGLTRVEGDRHDNGLKPEEIREAAYLDLTKKPITPSEEELNNNNRSHSAKLRAIMKK